MVAVVVDDRAVGQGLLDVADRVVHDHVAVREGLAHRPVFEDHLHLAVFVLLLHLAVLRGLADHFGLFFLIK